MSASGTKADMTPTAMKKADHGHGKADAAARLVLISNHVDRSLRRRFKYLIIVDIRFSLATSDKPPKGLALLFHPHQKCVLGPGVALGLVLTQNR